MVTTHSLNCFGWPFPAFPLKIEEINIITELSSSRALREDCLRWYNHRHTYSNTPEVIRLCHHIPLSAVVIAVTFSPTRLSLRGNVRMVLSIGGTAEEGLRVFQVNPLSTLQSPVLRQPTYQPLPPLTARPLFSGVSTDQPLTITKQNLWVVFIPYAHSFDHLFTRSFRWVYALINLGSLLWPSVCRYVPVQWHKFLNPFQTVRSSTFFRWKIANGKLDWFFWNVGIGSDPCELPRKLDPSLWQEMKLDDYILSYPNGSHTSVMVSQEQVQFFANLWVQKGKWRKKQCVQRILESVKLSLICTSSYDHSTEIHQDFARQSGAVNFNCGIGEKCNIGEVSWVCFGRESWCMKRFRFWQSGLNPSSALSPRSRPSLVCALCGTRVEPVRELDLHGSSYDYGSGTR